MRGLLTLMSPVTHRGPPRRPPPHILDQVKALNQSLRLGHLLCRSRNPDFLLHIIQRQVSPALGRGSTGQEGSRGVPHRQGALGCTVSTASLHADEIQMYADSCRLALALQRAPLSFHRVEDSGHRAGPLLVGTLSAAHTGLLPVHAMASRSGAVQRRIAGRAACAVPVRIPAARCS